MLGLELNLVMYLWFDVIDNNAQFWIPLHLFWSLHWLKTYPTDSNWVCFWGVSINTLKKYAFALIDELFEHLNSVSNSNTTLIFINF